MRDTVENITENDMGNAAVDAVDAVEVPETKETEGILAAVIADDRGMSTIEYALGCVAAAALGALLYLVVTSDAVEGALTSIFQRALDTQ
ncbi:DUF4244 domain-containing protein [Corynebacterium sp. USCH3]|uniref:DUF4244 domain-containing protein n=1 Tax=Corynebacterium sp. USCH3 TaxID=3024840 RepID=UPI00403EF9E4